jgi:hypothetical protein
MTKNDPLEAAAEAAATQAQEDAELARLFPAPFRFKAGTYEIDILPMTVDVCLQCAREIKPILSTLAHAGMTSGTTIQSVVEAPEFALAISEHRMNFYRALGMAIARSPRYISKLPPGIATALVVTAWQLNTDFFVRAVASLGFSIPEAETAAAMAGDTGGSNL